ncbi:MAG TPA: Fe-S cluster assembly protein SufD [Streptosporangiaceae bacterium]|nr:Fe-S cluster assembly protein SufD [Streptosporangiaceae bacterium]
MSAGLAGAIETAPVTRLHELQSYDPSDFPVPAGREEEWRFTPLRRLRGLHADAPAGAPPSVEICLAPEVRADFAERASLRGTATFTPSDRVSARAYSLFGEAAVIEVPAQAEASTATIVKLTGSGAQSASYGHTVIKAGPLSRAIVVLDHRGSATHADNVEIVVGDGASLSVISMQDWASDAVHVSHHYATLGRDATLTHAAVSLGGSLVRLSPSVRYDGQGGNAVLNGLYFADAGQHLEHRLFVDHDGPNCRSRVTYKGALQGTDAHAVWIGDVLIRASATGTDTYEYNRNLVLTDGTRVDSVPNLEILTGEITGAGHASASGRLEDHHLFYLMARGIPFEEARRLVIRGFFGQLIAEIEVPELRERITESVERELA